MQEPRSWLNAIGIFAATTFVIVYFELSPLWYSAALLAWIVRRHSLYQVRRPAKENAPQAADEGSGLLLATPPAAPAGDGARADPDAR
jgi:hypothetical protein